jgi:phospholipid-binding lipoprotein MlaA
VISDPLEPVNRTAFWINDQIYGCLLTPAANALKTIPFSLRGKISAIMNQIFGLTTDVLSRVGFRNAGSEFGAILFRAGSWTVSRLDPESSLPGKNEIAQLVAENCPDCYLVLPVIGPSTLRHGAAFLGRIFFDTETHSKAVNTLASREEPNLPKTLQAYEQLTKEALDPYSFIRTAFAQQRMAEIKSDPEKS